MKNKRNSAYNKIFSTKFSSNSTFPNIPLFDSDNDDEETNQQSQPNVQESNEKTNNISSIKLVSDNPKSSEDQSTNMNIQMSNNAYYYSKLDAKEILETAQITKERKVLIFYSCGSIAMKLNETEEGFSYDKNFLFKFMSNHLNFCDKEYTIQNLNKELDPEGFLSTPNNIFKKRIHYKVLEANKIIDSSSMTLDMWKKVGRVIRNNYEDFDAFIILHGSDTMTYTASMLSFMLENLSKPVILTGAQIPLTEMRNDAMNNLINALTIAGFYQIPEVCLLFGSGLFRGNRTIKDNNMDFDAFESPNMRLLAHLGVQISVNWDVILREPQENFNFFEDFNNNICTVKIFPMIDDETFASFFQPPIEAVIIETYGGGNVPSNRPKLLEIIKKANDRGVIILNVSQCRKGEVSSSYETGSVLERIGVIFAGDITVECALAKLAYLLGKKYDKKTIQKLLKESLRGELTVAQEEFFSFQSNSFINNILKMMDLNKGDKDSHIVFKTLVPSIIIELIEQHNLDMLKKFENEIRHIHFAEYSKKSPLHVAAKIGNEKIVEFLLKFKNLRINQLDFKKMTPLNYACLYKNKKVCEMIRSRGGILSEDPELNLGTLFCKLAYEGDLENLKLFYNCGADLINIRDYVGRNCAHIASAEGKLAIIKFLIFETGYNINLPDKKGRTPLWESKRGNPEVRKLLIERYGSNLQKIKLKKTMENYNENKNNANQI
jgi:60kDa lysophospholipase